MITRPTERERLLFKLDRLTETEITEVLDYVTLLESNQATLANDQSPLFPEIADDDLVTTLGLAYENRRARQVVEWEAIRRRADSVASARHYARP
ncbi:MAG: hypothetical protein HYR56_35400 [Acidobacteria bacterium]|nr:hypothetical protein [Acidobacteriota bacterium]MBI3421563.1 hypothetical protein [Acidobacteriota bacterium]